MTADEETLAVYDARARDYAQLLGAGDSNNPGLRAFIDGLPPGGRVLDLGCGPGTWARHMLAAGLRVDGVDASAAMVAEAARVDGLTVWQARFDEITGTDCYDGVWANFSLLHAPRDAMPGHLAALHAALKPGGLMHIGLKQGEGSARDTLGRFYTYWTVPGVTALLADLGMQVQDLRQDASKGLDGVVSPWFTLIARKAP